MIPYQPNSQNQQQQVIQRSKNDYCQQFIETGERPQNFIRDIKQEERFLDYPKLNELIKLKEEFLQKRNTPPMVLKTDIKRLNLGELGKFDIILMDPPWSEYRERLGEMGYQGQNEKLETWKFEEIMNLKIEHIADTPSFMFLWVGSQNLEAGRELFKKWGYKRCEDIVWIKTNKKTDQGGYLDTKSNTSYLHRVKEHCLVGYVGDVRRASDSHFIHANIDTDVIVEEEPPNGSPQKPDEIYDIIERFCLGRKRLELFADHQSIRPGWLSVGKYLPESDYNRAIYNGWFNNYQQEGVEFNEGRYLGTSLEIENLRPKSPSKANQTMIMGQGQDYDDFYNQMLMKGSMINPMAALAMNKFINP